MLIWTGWGWLVPVIVFVVSLLTQVTSQAVTGQDQIYKEQSWLFATSTLVSGIIVWFLGKYFDEKKGRVVIDKETGQEMLLRSSDSLFFVPLRFWAFILPVIGIVYALVD